MPNILYHHDILGEGQFIDEDNDIVLSSRESGGGVMDWRGTWI